MTEHGFDLPPKAPPEVVARRDAQADEVCRALARAGIPVYRAGFGGDVEERAGAEVHVDALVVGGVLVEWNTATELTEAAVNLLAGGVDPSALPDAIRHFETVHAGMRRALLEILVSAGFPAEQADPHTYGAAILVRDL
ncbi:hypothetical protein [Streptomyces sp. NPDC008125]|uniref:hypothetical protein n=1 Tax=Streptomyces sp. NPDC008125 TaxID=3364811 RepID=UPI0036EDA86A